MPVIYLTDREAQMLSKAAGLTMESAGAFDLWFQSAGDRGAARVAWNKLQDALSGGHSLPPGTALCKVIAKGKRSGR
jgi:hypothetical protein